MKHAEIKLGSRCNNNCIFCTANNKINEMSTNEIKNIIKGIDKKQHDTITLTGGEPTIRKDFYQICKHIKEKGFNLIIQTNGRMFSYPKFTKKITKLGITKICVSLHGLKKTHDNISKVNGSFQQTINGIKNLKKLNVFVSINFVINKYNLNEMQDFTKILPSLNVDKIQYSWLEPNDKIKEYSKNAVKFSDVTKNLFMCLELLKNTKIKTFMVGIPPCILGEKYERCNLSPPDMLIYLKEQRYSYNKNTRNEKLVKIDECKKCSNTLCEGIYKKYIETFGKTEFKSIKK